MSARVAVIVVSYNVVDLLRQCLTSLCRTAGVDLDIFVVDNASSDGSSAMVADEFPQVALIANNHNHGFAYANNQALRQLQERTPGERGEFVLLLNPDTKVPESGIARLAAFLNDRPDAAMVGPKLIRGDGSLDLACRRSFPTPTVSLYRQVGLSQVFPKSRRFGRYNLTYLDPDETYEVDSVVGACMLVRWTAIEQVGLLDDSFFMYGEDLDWSLRMKQRGWRIHYCPDVEVLHLKGQSSRRRSYRATQEFYRAMLLFYRKHYAKTTPKPLGALVVGGIYTKAAFAFLRNALRPTARRRVS